MKIVGRILKILCLVLVFGIIGFMLLRICMAEYYPGAMKDLYKSETLAQAAGDGTVDIHRQDLRASYDNPNFALFMADYQYYSPEAGELQITLRYNNNTLNELASDYGLEKTPAPSLDLFEITLVANSGEEDENGEAIPGASYPVAYVETDSAFLYQYYKLTFTGLDFETVDWYRLEIRYTGEGAFTSANAAKRWPAKICVWEKEMVPYDTVYTLKQEDFS